VARKETARRPRIVEDLMKAGLSIRMISDATDIPRSSVHRAMRAIAQAHFASLLVIEVWTLKCGRLTLPRGASTLQNYRIEGNVDAVAKHREKFSFLRPHLASTLQPLLGRRSVDGISLPRPPVDLDGSVAGR
jgi:hypothetical protein